MFVRKQISRLVEYVVTNQTQINLLTFMLLGMT